MKPQRNSRPREMMEIFLFCGVLLGCANIWCSLLWMISCYNHGKDASDHRETVSAAAPSPSGAAEQLHGNSSPVDQGGGIWRWGAVAWEQFCRGPGGGVVSERFKHITCTVHFISVIIISAPSQIIGHQILEMGDPWTLKRFLPALWMPSYVHISRTWLQLSGWWREG